MPADNFYIGSISMFSGTYAPLGWAECNGALIAIDSNQALFSVLGTTYGGDGRSTFALPNLSERLPLGYKSGQYPVGAMGGSFMIRIPDSALPPHTHSLTASKALGTKETGKSMVFAQANSAFDTKLYESYTPHTLSTFSPKSIDNAGAGQAFPHYPPVQVIRYCICIEGLFPPRT